MSDVFREVDEAVRQDQFKQIWKRYGWVIVGVVVVVVLGVGGYQFWKAQEADRRTEASDAYAVALQLARTGQVGPSLAALAALSDPADGEVGTLAAFAEARVLAGQGRREEAVALWDQLAASDAAGPTFKNAALILSVQNQIDAGDPAALAQRLQPLLAEGQAFRPAAAELSALLALRQGDEARARELLADLTTAEDVPPSLRDRATQLLQAIGP